MNNQRGYLVVFVAVIMLLIVASCTQTAGTPMEPTSAPTATSLPAPTATASPGPTATPVPTVEPGDFERQVMVNDRERSYLLHVPPGLSSQAPVPVVFAFHDVRMAASGVRAITDFNDIADEADFLAVYPQGVGNSWNVEEGAWGDASAENVDEPAFLRQMLADLDTVATIDPTRIYAVGFGQGAMLAYTLACDVSDTLAAIGSVGGTMRSTPCEPEEAVSVIHVHGLTDGVVPYEGLTDHTYAHSGAAPFDLPSAEEAVDTWAEVAGCTDVEVERPSDVVTHTVRSSCQTGTAVELYAIEPLTHRWPPDDLFPASETIWDFFAAHPKP